MFLIIIIAIATINTIVCKYYNSNCTELDPIVYILKFLQYETMTLVILKTLGCKYFSLRFE